MNVPETLFTGKNAIFLPEVDSTNAHALDLLSKTNPQEGTCIFSDYQTAGRGQIGRYWHSSQGKNLLISYIFYPKFIKVTDQFLLNIVASLAVYDVICQYTTDVKIKWPNDIYVNDKKIAGILIQSLLRSNEIRACVIGIGINVNENSFPEILPNPTSLFQLKGANFECESIRLQLSSRLEYYYLKMKGLHYNYLKELYLNAMYRFGIPADYKLLDDRIIHGTITGIDDSGKLLISRNGTIMHFDFREISFLI